MQVVAGAIWGKQPPTSVSQPKAITALQEIFESWRTLAPPSLQPNHRPAPASPRLNSRDSPRVVAPSPPSTSPMRDPSTAWSPPLQAAVTSLTPLPSAPTFHVTPHHLIFSNDHSPRVVSKPQQPLLPPAALGLPVWEPIAHCTRSRAPAPLALIASGRRYHECIQYRIPTAKTSCSPPVAIGFAGLCAMHHMTTPKTTNFAAFCSALSHEDNLCWPCQSLTLQPALFWSIANSDVILDTKPHGILHTPMRSAISAKALAQGRPPAPSV